jgi:hypothetical protein
MSRITSFSELVSKIVGSRIDSRKRWNCSGDMWMAAILQEEWGLQRGRMGTVVVGKLGRSKPFIPISLHKVHVQSQILFQLLVNMFSLAISLGMISSRECSGDPEQGAKCSCKLGSKLHSSISNNLLRPSMVFPYVVSKQLCGTFSREI